MVSKLSRYVLVLVLSIASFVDQGHHTLALAETAASSKPLCLRLPSARLLRNVCQVSSSTSTCFWQGLPASASSAKARERCSNSGLRWRCRANAFKRAQTTSVTDHRTRALPSHAPWLFGRFLHCPSAKAGAKTIRMGTCSLGLSVFGSPMVGSCEDSSTFTTTSLRRSVARYKRRPLPQQPTVDNAHERCLPVA